MPSAPKIKYSAIWVVAASAALLAVLVALYIATGLESGARKRIGALTKSNEGARRANAALNEFNDDALAKTRAQADMFRATLLNEARIGSFKQEHQPFWRVAEASAENTQEYRKVRFELSRAGGQMSDWPRIVETVQNLQASPGMTVRQVEIFTSGDGNQRVFDRVTLGVTLFTRLSEKK
jgi:hypothetical protein